MIKFFNRSKIDCPRCLGKGAVDWNDIKRLKQELRWKPGKCAYCNGSGKIKASTQSKIAVDNSYLTIDLDPLERIKVLKNTKGALKRAAFRKKEMDDLIHKIEYLHFEKNTSVDEIVTYHLIPNLRRKISSKEKADLIDFINQVIAYKS